VTDPVIMPAKEEHGCDSGSKSFDKHEPRGIVYCHVERRPDFHFVLAMDVIVCTTGVGNVLLTSVVYESDHFGGGSVMVWA
jgi:hypothetical protein